MSENTISKNLTIQYGGDLQSINIEVLVASIINISSLIRGVANYIAHGNRIDIKIQTLKDGFFIIELYVVKNEDDDFSIEVNLSNLIFMIGSLYDLKQSLVQHGHPQVIYEYQNVLKLSNATNTIQVAKDVYNIYKHSARVRDNIRLTFDKLRFEKDITSFSIYSDGIPICEISNAHFALLASSEDEKQHKRQIEIRKHQVISLFKMVLHPVPTKWEFYYGGSRLYISIRDLDFLTKVQNGEITLKNGDKLIVDLEIEQFYNEVSDTYSSDYYYIKKFIDIIPRIPDPNRNL